MTKRYFYIFKFPYFASNFSRSSRYSFLCCFQDEDFVAEKDDSGSPTDDSGEEESDASKSGDERQVYR